MEGRELKGLQAAVVAYVGWGLLTIYWKQLTGFDALELLGWRIATACVVMVVITAALGRTRRLVTALRQRSIMGPITLAGVLLTINWSTYIWAVVNERIIETALGYFLAPLGTMALGVFLLGEQLTPLKKLSIGFAAVAVVVLTVSYGRMPWVALLLAGTWSWYGLTKRRVPLDPIESLTAELVVLLLPSLALVGLGFVRTDGIPSQAAGADWALLLGTGVITAAPLLLFAYAAQRVPFTLLGPTNYLVPIINFLLGWLVYGEALPPSRVVGFALVWVALMLVTVDTMRGEVERRSQRDVTSDPSKKRSRTSTAAV